MTDFKRTAGLLRELQTLGVRIAIDDFGTGHSSLQYLQALPAGHAQDPEAVHRHAGRGGGGELARAIVDLGRSFGLTVVAEGIETEAQRDALRALGCTRGQGYLFARPLTAEALLTAV